MLAEPPRGRLRSCRWEVLVLVEPVGWSRVVEGLHAALDEVAGLDPLFLPTASKGELLLDLAGVESRLRELRLRVLAAADDVAETDGSRDAAAWLAYRINADYAPMRSELELARGLSTLPALAAALADAKVRPEQARVIAAAVDALPAVGADVRVSAEAWLVGAAAHHTPRELRVLGRRILDVVAPEIAEAEEAKRLAAEEAAAYRATKLTLRDLPDGTTRISGLIPALAGHRLRTYLEALSSPRSMAEVVGPIPRRHGQAFCELLENLDSTRLPEHGGDATTVVVTIDHDALTRELAVAGVIGGEPITAAATRRLACNAKVLPAVLGGRGEVLDLGRARRLFSSAQHKALRLRDQRCRGEGCTVPATWCEAHHLHPWSRGGRTDLADGVLLCSHHHHRAHDPAYLLDRLPNGDVRFTRRR